jgi:hypothetical protein
MAVSLLLRFARSQLLVQRRTRLVPKEIFHLTPCAPPRPGTPRSGRGTGAFDASHLCTREKKEPRRGFAREGSRRGSMPARLEARAAMAGSNAVMAYLSQPVEKHTLLPLRLRPERRLGLVEAIGPRRRSGRATAPGPAISLAAAHVASDCRGKVAQCPLVTFPVCRVLSSRIGQSRPQRFQCPVICFDVITDH